MSNRPLLNHHSQLDRKISKVQEDRHILGRLKKNIEIQLSKLPKDQLDLPRVLEKMVQVTSRPGQHIEKNSLLPRSLMRSPSPPIHEAMGTALLKDDTVEEVKGFFKRMMLEYTVPTSTKKKSPKSVSERDNFKRVHPGCKVFVDSSLTSMKKSMEDDERRASNARASRRMNKEGEDYRGNTSHVTCMEVEERVLTMGEGGGGGKSQYDVRMFSPPLLTLRPSHPINRAEEEQERRRLGTELIHRTSGRQVTI